MLPLLVPLYSMQCQQILAGGKGQQSAVHSFLNTSNHLDSRWNENKITRILYPQSLNVDEGILPAESLHSDSSETFPPSEYTDHCCRL